MTARSSVYRKRGRVARLEDGVLLDISERGIAWEQGGTFFCEPEEGTHLPSVNAERVLATADEVRSIARGRVSIERLIVSEGRAEHEYGHRRWSDSAERVHVALTAGRFRTVLDLGSFELRDVRAAADALARAETAERPAPPAVRLVPAIAAALVSGLIGVRADVALVQRAGGVDGFGVPVGEADAGDGVWPNSFRPSYRMRPVRMPFNVSARAASSEVDQRLPVAVALLEPPHGGSLRVLVDDGVAVFPTVLAARRIRAVAREAVWYPLGAGSFGAEMML